MITVYSTNCPNCKVLKLKLQKAEIDFDLVEDQDQVLKKAEELNILSAPFMIVDGKVYNYMQAIKLINSGELKK